MGDLYIAVDLGGTNTRVLIGTQQGVTIKSITTPTRVELDSVDLQKDIISTIEKMMTGLSQHSFRAIGMGIPGVYYDQKVYLCDNIKNLGVDMIKQHFSDEYNAPTFIMNDVKCAALGEVWKGAGKAVRNGVYVNLGTGSSIAVIIDERVYLGNNNAAGEIGYMLTDIDDLDRWEKGIPPFENMFSGMAIGRDFKRLLQEDKDTILIQKVEGNIDKIDTQLVFWGYKQRDRLCIEFIKRKAKYLAMVLSNISTILNPEVLILGGGIADNFGIIKEIVHEYIHQTVPFPPIMVKAEMGDMSGLLGALKLAIDGYSKNKEEGEKNEFI